MCKRYFLSIIFFYFDFFITRYNKCSADSVKILLAGSEKRNGDARRIEKQIEGSGQRDSENVRSYS